MTEWCKKTHGNSGLTKKVKSSNLTLYDAEQKLLNFLKHDCGIKQWEAPLAGNSISHDKLFIKKDMPRLYNFLHYRIIDVTSVRHCAFNWYDRDTINPPKKELTHRALDDIKESIVEL